MPSRNSCSQDWQSWSVSIRLWPKIPTLIMPNINGTNSWTSGRSAGHKGTLTLGNGGPYINHRGVVVGRDPEYNSAYISPGLCLLSGAKPEDHAFKHVHGKTIDLGALEPAEENCSDALGINNRGEIAGLSSSSVVDPLLGMNESRAVIWKDGELLDLGTFGGNDASASWMDDRGQVAGFALNDISDPFSLFGFFFNGSSNSTQTRAFLWENGKMKDLGTLGGPECPGVPGQHQ